LILPDGTAYNYEVEVLNLQERDITEKAAKVTRLSLAKVRALAAEQPTRRASRTTVKA
jgi:hypothetical protein